MSACTIESDKKSGVSNWFSSLRRQPKSKKTPANDKKLQKSCNDLTASSATNWYTDINIDSPSTAISACDHAASSSTGDLPTANNKKVSTSFRRKFLKHQNSIRNSKDNFANINNKLKENDITIHNTDDDTIDSSVNKNLINKTTCSGSSGSSKDELRTIIKKTTTVTTTIINKQSHRIGLIFNDDGDILNNSFILKDLIDKCDTNTPKFNFCSINSSLNKCDNSSNVVEGIDYIDSFSSNEIHSRNFQNVNSQELGSQVNDYSNGHLNFMILIASY